MSIWSDLADDIRSSDLANSIIYMPQNRNDVEIPALVGQPENEGEIGRVRVRQDTVRLEVRVTDLEQPVRRDRFILDGSTYVVSADAPLDESGKWWLITGNKASSA